MNDYQRLTKPPAERLINCVQDLQLKVEHLQAELIQNETQNRESNLALRSLIRGNGSAGAGIDVTASIEDAVMSDTTKEDKWDSYRNSFTLLMSKGYLQAVDQMRNRLLASEWELGQRPVALFQGVATFEQWCVANDMIPTKISFDIIGLLYENPEDLSIITDEKLRSQARSIIALTEVEGRTKVYANCTVDAQKLASQFSEGEFISKIIPDPIEQGVADSLRKLVIPMSRLMSGGRM